MLITTNDIINFCGIHAGRKEVEILYIANNMIAIKGSDLGLSMSVYLTIL